MWLWHVHIARMPLRKTAHGLAGWKQLHWDTVVVEDHPKIAPLQVSTCGIASILRPSLKPPKLRCSYHCSALLSTENTYNVSEVYEMGFSHFRSDYYPASQMLLASCIHVSEEAGQVTVNFTVIIPRGHLAYSILITKILACLSHSLVSRVQCAHDYPEEVSFCRLARPLISTLVLLYLTLVSNTMKQTSIRMLLTFLCVAQAACWILTLLELFTPPTKGGRPVHRYTIILRFLDK